MPLENQDKIDRQISKYKNARGLFGFDIAIRNQKKNLQVKNTSILAF